jgi:hypothetical protein
VSSKIDVRKIIRAHLATFHDADTTGRASIQDMLVFLGLPIAVAAILTWRNIGVASNQANTLITAMSVFGALLFNLLILIYDVAMRTDYSSGGNARLRIMFVKEIHANIEFAILVAIISIVALVASTLETGHWQLRVTGFVIYYLLGVFLLTLLMVLKRIHVLLVKEIDNNVPS